MFFLLIEKIFGLSNHKKSIYNKAVDAINHFQFEFKDLDWIPYGRDNYYTGYDIVFKIENTEFRMKSLTCDSLTVKVENGEYLSCEHLNSAHLQSLIKKLAIKTLVDKEKSILIEKSHSVYKATKALVS